MGTCEGVDPRWLDPGGTPPLYPRHLATAPAAKVGRERVPDIFDEVDDDLRADKARAMLRRYGAYLVLAMLLTLVGVGVYQKWEERQQAAADALGAKFIQAQKASQVALPPKDLPEQFRAIAGSGSEGYKVLATLQLAAIDWAAGRQKQALAGWQSVEDDRSAPQLLRDLALLSSIQQQIDTGDAKALKTQLLPIVQAGGAFRPLALETQALLDVKLGRMKEAKAVLHGLTEDPSASQELRQLAQNVLLALSDDEAGAAQ